MKTSVIAFALVAGAMTGIAHAAITNEPVNAPSTQAAQAVAHHAYAGKTRADVKRELVQAQRDGQIAGLRSLYRGS